MARCSEIDAKCAEAAQTIQDLQALKTSLLQQMGEAAPPPSVAKNAWAEKISVSGYFQTRWDSFETNKAGAPEAPGTDRFDIRRMYLNFNIQPNPRVLGVITLARDGVDQFYPTWAQAFVNYKLFPQDYVQLGQASTAFGLEESQSSSQRLPFERAAFNEGDSRGKPAGLFFAGPYDRGFMWYHTPTDPARMQAIFGVTNGEFRSVELTPGANPHTNDHVALEADLKWHPSWGQYGLSWVDGSFTTTANMPVAEIPLGTPAQFARNAIDGYVRYAQPKVWAAQFEGLNGENFGHSIAGWYGQVEAPLRNTPGTFFAKYEWYNPDKDDPTHANLYKAWDLGYAHQLDVNDRLTLQIATGAKRGPNGLDETGVQWQLAF
jgi:hypothetical protein